MQITRPPSKQPLPPHARLVFLGVLADVYHWEQELYDGTKMTFEKIIRADSVQVIPVTSEGKIIIMDQEQPGLGKFTSLVGGKSERGEDPFLAAKRELLEETGMEGERWELLASFNPFATPEWMWFYFVVKDLKKITEPHPDGGERITLREVTFDRGRSKSKNCRFRGSNPEAPGFGVCFG